ncbi:hypothetical protein Scep_019987 [Stephania cephalantha]|uniref:Uncharacterized protein n=1 Tax=Stephania cephalantha TaxID=152367 RepID=A0AAP0IBX5_9MAGN
MSSLVSNSRIGLGRSPSLKYEGRLTGRSRRGLRGRGRWPARSSGQRSGEDEQLASSGATGCATTDGQQQQRLAEMADGEIGASGASSGGQRRDPAVAGEEADQQARGGGCAAARRGSLRGGAVETRGSGAQGAATAGGAQGAAKLAEQAAASSGAGRAGGGRLWRDGDDGSGAVTTTTTRPDPRRRRRDDTSSGRQRRAGVAARDGGGQRPRATQIQRGRQRREEAARQQWGCGVVACVTTDGHSSSNAGSERLARRESARSGTAARVATGSKIGLARGGQASARLRDGVHHGGEVETRAARGRRRAGAMSASGSERDSSKQCSGAAECDAKQWRLGDLRWRDRRRRGEQRDGVVGPIAPRRGCESTNVDDAMEGVETLLFIVYLWHTRSYAGKPGERKWGLPLKGSRGYENQVKGSGARTERIWGFDVRFSVIGRSTRYVSLVLFIHVMILAQLVCLVSA